MSVRACIAGIGTAIPPHRVTQAEARAFAERFFRDDLPDVERMLTAFDNTGIEQRWLARPLEWYERQWSFVEKNQVYRSVALDLSRRAASEAIRVAGLAVDDLGAVVFVSTTGISTPSLDSALIGMLDLPRSVARVPVWGLGCAGGAAGLARAADLVRGTGRSVLLVAVEVCSTTFVHADRSKSNFVATALFGDGAAAVVLCPDRGTPEVVAGRSRLLDGTEDVMGWTLRAQGLEVRFARSIPRIVRDVARGFLDEIGALVGASSADIRHLVLHPGGARVLRAYEEALDIPRSRIEPAWSILREFGNMSSPTVLFVLRRLLETRAPTAGLGAVVGLGPGFSAEGALLRW